MSPAQSALISLVILGSTIFNIILDALCPIMQDFIINNSEKLEGDLRNEILMSAKFAPIALGISLIKLYLLEAA